MIITMNPNSKNTTTNTGELIELDTANHKWQTSRVTRHSKSKEKLLLAKNSVNETYEKKKVTCGEISSRGIYIVSRV